MSEKQRKKITLAVQIMARQATHCGNFLAPHELYFELTFVSDMKEKKKKKNVPQDTYFFEFCTDQFVVTVAFRPNWLYQVSVFAVALACYGCVFLRSCTQRLHL